MAVVNSNSSLMSFNNSFSRLDGSPLDSTEIWNSLDDAKEYAKTANAYVGQIIKVVDDSTNNLSVNAYMIIDTVGNLKDVTGCIVDSTLTILGSAADAKTVGDKINNLNQSITDKLDKNLGAENIGKMLLIDENGDVIPMSSLSSEDLLVLLEDVF